MADVPQRPQRRHERRVVGWIAAPLLAVLGGCSADPPTAPSAVDQPAHSATVAEAMIGVSSDDADGLAAALDDVLVRIAPSLADRAYAESLREPILALQAALLGRDRVALVASLGRARHVVDSRAEVDPERAAITLALDQLELAVHRDAAGR